MDVADLLDQLGMAGVGRGDIVALVVAPGAGLGLAVPGGPEAWSIDAPDPTEPFLLDDVLYLVGSGEAIVLARELLEGPAPASPTLGMG